VRIVVQQPNFFPWLGYFDLLASCDQFVWLDNVQWSRTGRQHRCRILSIGSNPWLTLPMESHNHRSKTLAQMTISPLVPWQEKLGQKLQGSYSTLPFFATDLWPLWESFCERSKQINGLSDLAILSIETCCQFLGIQPSPIFCSALTDEKDPNQRLIKICGDLNGTEYFSSLSGTRYLSMADFRAHGIQVRFQHFRIPNDPFPHLPLDRSILDWIGRLGREETARVLKASRSRGNRIWSNGHDEGAALSP
jgi:hypothetical protein